MLPRISDAGVEEDRVQSILQELWYVLGFSVVILTNKLHQSQPPGFTFHLVFIQMWMISDQCILIHGETDHVLALLQFYRKEVGSLG